MACGVLIAGPGRVQAEIPLENRLTCAGQGAISRALEIPVLARRRVNFCAGPPAHAVRGAKGSLGRPQIAEIAERRARGRGQNKE